MIQTSPLSETPNIISIANLLWGLVLYGHSAVSAAESVAMTHVVTALVTSPSFQLMHWLYTCWCSLCLKYLQTSELSPPPSALSFQRS